MAYAFDEGVLLISFYFSPCCFSVSAANTTWAPQPKNSSPHSMHIAFSIIAKPFGLVSLLLLVWNLIKLYYVLRRIFQETMSRPQQHIVVWNFEIYQYLNWRPSNGHDTYERRKCNHFLKIYIGTKTCST